MPWKCGIATLSAGSIYKGILEIYGTSGTFEMVYLIIGSVLCIMAAIIQVGVNGKTNKDCESSL